MTIIYFGGLAHISQLPEHCILSTYIHVSLCMVQTYVQISSQMTKCECWKTYLCTCHYKDYVELICEKTIHNM